MAIAYINLGSNLGNRGEFIQRALEKISSRFGVCCISNYIESEPWGFESDNRFLNLGVSFKTEMLPEELLLALQSIEKSVSSSSHRDSEGNYIDREIDIDIMAIDDLSYNSERLKVPHPHLHDRDFFLIPFKELQIKHSSEEI